MVKRALKSTRMDKSSSGTIRAPMAAASEGGNEEGRWLGGQDGSVTKTERKKSPAWSLTQRT